MKKWKIGQFSEATIRTCSPKYVLSKILKNSHMCWSLFLNKAESMRPSTSSKMRLRHSCFRLNFMKLFSTPFLQTQTYQRIIYCQISEAAAPRCSLKPDCHFPKKLFYFLQWKPFKNDEKCFLFHLKSCSHSQDI